MSEVLARRAGTIDRMVADPLDVFVVGGGATGAGIALDAASRGYRVALVERHDLASGTSSKSSKLIHGGLRYLATGDIPMVVEGVRERNRLAGLAPHLVRPLGFVVPLDTRLDQAMLRVGLAAYDAMGIGQGGRRHRVLTQEEVRVTAPSLVKGARYGGVRYDDAQTDDARLVLAVTQTAHRHGALVLNHMDAVGVETGTHHHLVALRDRVTGESVDVRARWVVHAAGVWADHLGTLGPADLGTEIRPAKGVHLVFPRSLLPVDRALVLPSVSGDGRRVFLIPWGEQVYLGTTDDLETDTASGPTITLADAEYLLNAVNDVNELNLSVDDSIGGWAGWRPLVAAEASTKDLSRKHVIQQPRARLLVVTGGKLTTYRRMARDVVDEISSGDGIRARCQTHRIQLGAVGSALEGLGRTRRHLTSSGDDPHRAGSLYHRHGDAAPDVIDGFEPGGLEPLDPTLPYVVGELRHAVRAEWALTLDDLLTRRLRVSLRHCAAGGDEVIRRAADVLSEELGWDDKRRDAEIARYLDGVRRERGVVPLRSTGPEHPG